MGREAFLQKAPYGHKRIGETKAKQRLRQKKYLDLLWGKVVRTRDCDTCQRCGRPGNNPHHIFSKKNIGARWVPENGITLCWACHKHYAHGDYEPFRDFVLGHITHPVFAKIKQIAYLYPEPDLWETKVVLESKLKEIENETVMLQKSRSKGNTEKVVV